MKKFICVLTSVFFISVSPITYGQSYENAAVEQIYETTSIDKKLLDGITYNALSNSIEFAIWSLTERKTVAASQALASLVEVRLGESHTRDRDCAILSRGSKLLPFLSAYSASKELVCIKRVRKLGQNEKSVCVELNEAKKVAQSLITAINNNKKC